ncbi:diguanylate cyclase domain-containing protein [Kaarinaea lacus]
MSRMDLPMFNDLSPEQTSNLVDTLPVGVMLIDETSTVRWMNQTLRQWLGNRADMLENKPFDSIPENLHCLYATDDTFCLEAGDGLPERWLNSTTHPIEGGGKAQYLSDVTPIKLLIEERDKLKDNVQALTVHDEETGMPNRRALIQNLESEVSRSRRYGNLLSLLLLRVNNADQFKRQFELDSAKPLLLAIRNMLNDQFRWADIIGRIDETDFLLILPETSIDATRELGKLLLSRLQNLKIDGYDNEAFQLKAQIGIAEWQKGDDVGLLIERTREDMNKPGNGTTT